MRNISLRKTFPEKGGKLLCLSHSCLDAPLVAVSWSVLLAQYAGGSIHWANQIALFCATWLIYLGDRLYDVRAGASIQRTSLRHQFAKRFRKVLIWCAGFAIAAGLATIPFLREIDWILCLVLALGVGLYFFAFRLVKKRRLARALPLKEICIAVCFAAGVFVASGMGLRPAPWGIIGSLACLFLANCLLISYAEKDQDREGDPAAFFAQSGTWPIKVLSIVFFACWILVIACIMGNSDIETVSKRIIGIPYGLALGCLILINAKIDRVHRYAQPLGDASLLSPLLVLIPAFLMKIAGML